MSKMKKILAMVLTVAMMVAMTIPAFAEATEDTATITVNGADGAMLKYVQVIVPDRATKTGWNFTNGAEAYYLEAFGGNDAQAVIQAMIDGLKENSEYGDISSQVATAIDGVAASIGKVDMGNPQTVTSAGVYVITATDPTNTYQYNTMAAYVGFGEAEGETYPALQDATVNAKKTNTTITKADDDANNVVHMGQIVTYTVNTTIPRFAANEENKTFSITDTLTGAEYYLEGDGAQASVTFDNVTLDQIAFVVNEEGNSFAINLDQYVKDNTYAGANVTVTYTVKVTEEKVVNTAASHISGGEKEAEPIELFTGEVVMTKVDAENETIKLAGAEFEVTKEGEKLYFVKDSEGVYKLADAKTEGAVTKVAVAEAGEALGTVTLKGLEDGDYVFTETKAPEGYSVNETPETAAVTLAEGKAEAEAEADVIDGSATMKDTKLGALPATGGIGTTIFTVVGCLIMVAAVGLFFASRRKEEK